MEVQLEFLDGDSTIIHCKYNNHVYKEIKKLCGTCHRPKPYHHAGFKEKTKRKRKDKKRKIKDTYTNSHTSETRSCKYTSSSVGATSKKNANSFMTRRSHGR